MRLNDLLTALGRTYTFKPEQSQSLIDFISETESLKSYPFYFSYNVCRAIGEKSVLHAPKIESQLEKLLKFHDEVLGMLTINGSESGRRRASQLHQNFANIYSKLYDTDSAKNTTNLEKAFEHSIKSADYTISEAHRAFSLGFAAEFSRKIFQNNKDTKWADISLSHYQQSLELSQNLSHKAHCKSYMADIKRDLYEITLDVNDAKDAINYYLQSANELETIKPTQVFHNFAYAGDVAFSVFVNTDDVNFLQKSHALYYNALRTNPAPKNLASTHLNIARNARNLYKKLHTRSYIDETIHHTTCALEKGLGPVATGYAVSNLSDILTKIPHNFVFPPQVDTIIELVTKTELDDSRAHISLASIYRGKFTQTNNRDYIKLAFDSYDKSIELSLNEKLRAKNLALAGKAAYSFYIITQDISFLPQAFEYHQRATPFEKESSYYAGNCAQKLYEATKQEHWKNKSLAQYVQFLNSPTINEDISKINDTKEHIAELSK